MTRTAAGAPTGSEDDQAMVSGVDEVSPYDCFDVATSADSKLLLT